MCRILKSYLAFLHLQGGELVHGIASICPAGWLVVRLTGLKTKTIVTIL
jgi:hypothetical protein